MKEGSRHQREPKNPLKEVMGKKPTGAEVRADAPPLDMPDLIRIGPSSAAISESLWDRGIVSIVLSSSLVAEKQPAYIGLGNAGQRMLRNGSRCQFDTLRAMCGIQSRKYAGSPRVKLRSGLSGNFA